MGGGLQSETLLKLKNNVPTMSFLNFLAPKSLLRFLFFFFGLVYFFRSFILKSPDHQDILLN
uniref:Uncharacterized protein n=1 Tax=Anguilla anguilla TaxID=7936 RepID=A0A0E9W1P3_ANGAN